MRFFEINWSRHLGNAAEVLGLVDAEEEKNFGDLPLGIVSSLNLELIVGIVKYLVAFCRRAPQAILDSFVHVLFVKRLNDEESTVLPLSGLGNGDVGNR